MKYNRNAKNIKEVTIKQYTQSSLKSRKLADLKTYQENKKRTNDLYDYGKWSPIGPTKQESQQTQFIYALKMAYRINQIKRNQFIKIYQYANNETTLNIGIALLESTIAKNKEMVEQHKNKLKDIRVATKDLKNCKKELRKHHADIEYKEKVKHAEKVVQQLRDEHRVILQKAFLD